MARNNPLSISFPVGLLGFCCAVIAINLYFPANKGFFEFLSSHPNEFLQTLFREIQNVSVLNVLATLFLFHLVKVNSYSKKGLDSYALITSLFFSAIQVLGLSLIGNKTLDFIFYSKTQFLIASISFIGFGYLYYNLIFWIQSKWPVWEDLNGRCNSVAFFTNLRNHLWVISFIALLIGWSLVNFILFPGSFIYDGADQLEQGLGLSELTLHHPFTPTFLITSFYKVGMWLSNWIPPILIGVAFQFVVGASIYSSIAQFTFKRTGSLLLVLLTILFYVLTPPIYTFIQDIGKDTLYFLFYSWFLLSCARIFCDGENKFLLFQLGISSLACCLTRYGTIFCIVPGLLGLAYVLKSKKITLLSLGVVFGLVGFNFGLAHWAKLEYNEPFEALSIPTQQIARLASMKRNEISHSDLDLIYKAFPKKSIDRYNPELSDPIKNENKFGTLSGNEKRHLIKVYIKYLFKYPRIYLESFLNNSFAYIYPFYFSPVKPLYWLGNGQEIKLIKTKKVVSTYLFPYRHIKTYENLLNLQKKIPILSFWINPGFYGWVLIFLFIAILKRHAYKSLVLLISPIMTLLICMASPVNGYLRYSLPIIAVTPLLVVIAFSASPKLESDQN